MQLASFSLVVTLRLSCHTAHEILVLRPGIELMSLALEGRFLTTGPPGKSQPTVIMLFNIRLLRKLLLNGFCCLKSLSPRHIITLCIMCCIELSELCFQEMNLAITWVGQTDEDWSVREEGSKERGLSWKPSEERI